MRAIHIPDAIIEGSFRAITREDFNAESGCS